MNEAEGINFSVGSIGGERKGPRRISSRPSYGLRYDNPCLADMLTFVENLKISEDDKNILRSVLKKKPHGSLSNFRYNYMNYLKRNS